MQCKLVYATLKTRLKLELVGLSWTSACLIFLHKTFSYYHLLFTPSETVIQAKNSFKWVYCQVQL